MTPTENAAAWFVDRHIDEGRGDSVAFEETGGGRVLTFGQLHGAAGQVAGALHRAGIMREERAAMLMLDTVEFPAVYWGAIKIGVVPVPLNTLLAAPIYDTILRDSRAAILFVSAALWDVVAPGLADNPFLRHVVVIGDGPDRDNAQGYGDFVQGADPCPTSPACADETAFWLYSSGSTGQPKGVRHVHSSMRAVCDSYGAQVLGIAPTDRIYSAAKLFFAYGLGNGMLFPMAVGARALLFDGRPTPDTTLDILRRLRPTIFGGVPTLYAATLAQMAGQPEKLALRRCISAGEALPEDIGRQWQALTGAEILDGVGSTEMLHIFLSNQPGAVVYGTSGIAVPGYDIRLLDEAGTEVPPGGIGELLVRGASAADGYWNQRTKSRATFEGEWTRTGDKYERREDGRLIYCGRTDDMFKVSGIWVSPFEVEQALSAHDDILEAAVVAARDADGLEKPSAFVVPMPGRSAPDEETLRDFVKTRVGKWKYPRWIKVVEALPKTATGKIQRFRLRETA